MKIKSHFNRGYIKKIIIPSYFLLIIFFVITNSSLSYASIYNPHFSYPSHGEDFNVSINSSNVSGIKLYFKPLIDDLYENITMSEFTNIGSNLKRDSIYQFYFLDSNENRFPQGTINFKMNPKNSIYNNIASNLITTEPSLGWDCNITNNRYGCDYENFQAFRALSFFEMYYLTQNETYSNIGIQLFNANYESVNGTGCNPVTGDFDCGYTNLHSGIKVDGSVKQGALIYSLWTSYQYLENNTLYELAINFTQGHAAECDVWSGDFDCGSSDSEGLMMLGYWKAYELTNNETYLSIANNLTSVGLSYTNSSYLLLALWKAYELSGNSSYYSKAISLSDEMINDCTLDVCTPENQALNILAYTTAYLNTESYEYQRAAEKKLYSGTNSNCNPITGNFNCENSRDIGLQTIAYLIAHQTLPNSTSFYQPKVLGVPKIETELNLSVRMKGNITNPKIYVKNILMPTWNVFSINNETGIATINNTNLAMVGIYEYYFNDSSSHIFPKNGSFRFSISNEFQMFKDKSISLLRDPKKYCDPFSSNSQLSDYSCKMENFQGWMILSTIDASVRLENETYKNISISLGRAEIDDTNTPDRYNTCDHYYNETNIRDFVCDYYNPLYPSAPRKEYGSIKQALMIKSMLRLYEETNDLFFYNLALKYLENSPSECNLWLGEFDCVNSKNQGMLMDAYLDAYKVIGNDDYLQIAINLSQHNYGTDSVLGMGLWHLYSLTQDPKHISNASAITSALSDECVNNSCSVDEHSTDLYSFWKSYLYSGDQLISNSAYLKSLSQTELTGDNCDPNDPSKRYQCIWPDQQGTYASSYNLGYDLFSVSNVTYDVNLYSNITSSKYLDLVNITCLVNNTEEFTVYNLNVFLQTNFEAVNVSTDGLPNYNKKMIEIYNLSAHEAKEITWVLNATYGEMNNISCNILGFSDSVIINVTDIRNIYHLLYDNISYSYYNTTFTQSYTITNNASFQISEFLLSLELPENGLHILNITTDINESIINESKYTVFLDLFASKSNITVNITYLINDTSEKTSKFKITSLFGANTSFNQTMHIYSFDVNFISNSTNPFLKKFNLTANVTNIASFNMTNVTIRLYSPINLITLSHNYSTTYLSLDNDSSAEYSLFEDNASMGLTWLTYASNVSNINVTLEITAPPNINFSSSYTLNITPNSYTATLSPSEKQISTVTNNEGFIFELTYNNSADFTQQDMKLILNLTNGTYIKNATFYEEFNGSFLANITYFGNEFNNTNQSNKTIHEFNFSIFSGNTSKISWIIVSPKDSTNNLSISITSPAGFFYYYNASIISTTPSSSDNTPNSGGSGGGGGGFGESPINYLEYNYNNYDLYNELIGNFYLYNYSNFDNNKSNFNRSYINNETADLIKCINVTRRVSKDNTTLSTRTYLNIYFKCQPTTHNFYILDKLKHLNESEGYKKPLFKSNLSLIYKQENESETDYLFFVNLSEFFENIKGENAWVLTNYSIEYEQSPLLIKDYTRPTIFVKPQINITNIIMNHTLEAINKSINKTFNESNVLVPESDNLKKIIKGWITTHSVKIRNILLISLSLLTLSILIFRMIKTLSEKAYNSTNEYYSLLNLYFFKNKKSKKQELEDTNEDIFLFKYPKITTPLYSIYLIPLYLKTKLKLSTLHLSNILSNFKIKSKKHNPSSVSKTSFIEAYFKLNHLLNEENIIEYQNEKREIEKLIKGLKLIIKTKSELQAFNEFIWRYHTITSKKESIFTYEKKAKTLNQSNLTHDTNLKSEEDNLINKRTLPKENIENSSSASYEEAEHEVSFPEILKDIETKDFDEIISELYFILSQLQTCISDGDLKKAKKFTDIATKLSLRLTNYNRLSVPKMKMRDTIMSYYSHLRKDLDVKLIS